MNILEAITGAQNGAAVEQLGARFGLQPDQASSAVAALLPALAAGMRRNMSTDDGLASLVSAVTNGHHGKYLDSPATLTEPATTADGNAILGHVFGSKEVSRQVAASASQRTGIDTGTLKQMLPIVAAMAMAGLSRQSRAGRSAPEPQEARAGFASMLEPMLDRNRDGSIVDDVAGMVGGFLASRRRG